MKYADFFQPDERPAIALEFPDRSLLEGESVTVRVFPPTCHSYEFEILGEAGRKREIYTDNQLVFGVGVTPGDYRIRVRCQGAGASKDGRTWSSWSLPLALTIYPIVYKDIVNERRVAEHQLAMMTDYTRDGTCFLSDPWARPPGCPDDGTAKWFATPAHEGCTMLVNMEEEYYQDPLRYLIDILSELRDKGFRFRSWHDWLDTNGAVGEKEILLQLDVDGGQYSLGRLLPRLLAAEVTGTIMTHAVASVWYQYSLEDLDLPLLHEAEEAGWAIGYHNNALSRVQGLERTGDYSKEVLFTASRLFREDLAILRQEFDVRTYTNHGGNTYNNRVPVPEGMSVLPVDKPANPDLWQDIRSMFSDGAFAARPTTLRIHAEALKNGAHFFRVHPFKYGNYQYPFDSPPLLGADRARLNVDRDPIVLEELKSKTQLQEKWWGNRLRSRGAGRISYASIHRPISARFVSRSSLQERVKLFRSRRRETFLRQYPWAWGDPRVFWWRMLHAWCPVEGEILNVGALPPGQKDETLAFAPPRTRIIEMDIDPAREPDIVGDVTAPDAALLGRFAAVLFFGLPYAQSPGLAMDRCYDLLRPGGIGLFGFAADTHPYRGMRYLGKTRPVWRRPLEPLPNPGLKGNLWSFDEEGLPNLLRVWPTWEAEFHMHYWFVVARNENT